MSAGRTLAGRVLPPVPADDAEAEAFAKRVNRRHRGMLLPGGDASAANVARGWMPIVATLLDALADLEGMEAYRIL